MARRWLVVCILLLIQSCASQPFKPEPIHPTWEQIEALRETVDRYAQVSTVPHSEPTLTVYPRFAFAGAAVWVTCYVPEHLGPGRIRFGLEGHAMSGPMPIERIEHRRLVEHLSPGLWQASCDIWTWERHIRLTQPLEVRGPDG